MIVNILKVEKEENNYKIFIENNPLYPDGKGGQLGDRGKIDNANIKYVDKKYILVDREINIGEKEVIIDKKNQKDISKQHTAQHILSAIMKDLYGLNTVGFRMSEEYSTIDIDKRISEELIKKIEDISNEKINENLDVYEKKYDRSEAENLSLRKDISEKITGDIRVIYIENLDASACGGFHVKNTLEINMIKIIKTENIKNSYMRIYFLAGKRVLNYLKSTESILNELGTILNTNKEDFISKITKIIEENDIQKKELDNLYSYKANNLIKNLEPFKIIKDINIFYLEKKDESFEYVYKNFDKENFIFILKDNDTYKIQSDSVNVGTLIKSINNKHSTKGGGGKNNGQIKGNISFENIIDLI